MDCSEIETRLTAYAIGELNAAGRARVEEHLAGCEACRREVEEIRETTDLLAGELADEPAVELGEAKRRLIEQAAAYEKQDPPRVLTFASWRVVVAAAVAASFVISSIAVLVWQLRLTYAPAQSPVVVGPVGPQEMPVDLRALLPPERQPGEATPVAPGPRVVDRGSPARLPLERTIGNAFLDTRTSPLSTFRMAADGGSLEAVRRSLLDGLLPPASSIRIEQLVNGFNYDYPRPAAGEEFAASIEVAACPWDDDYRLVRIGLAGREVPNQSEAPVIARDVKVQVEFNPRQVSAYRLLGYEESGEPSVEETGGENVVAGKSVTALYEVVPPGVAMPAEKELAERIRGLQLQEKAISYILNNEKLRDYEREAKQADLADVQRKLAELTGRPPGAGSSEAPPLRYQTAPALTEAADSGEMLTVRLSYRPGDAEGEKRVQFAGRDDGRGLEKASADFKWAACVATAGLLLGDTPHTGQADWEMARQLAVQGRGQDPRGHRSEFIRLLERAKVLDAARRGNGG